VCCLSAAASAQDRPTDFKALYAEAAYEEALALLAPLSTTEAYQYRALCLLALGRHQEAHEAVQALVAAAPTFAPSPEEVPPRFVELVANVRRALLPTLARRAFAEGRERFSAKAVDDAVRQFTLVLTLVSDPAFDDATTAQDLRTLAQGFIDLAHATAAAPPPEVVSKPVEPAPPPPVSAPTVTQAVAIAQTVPPLPSEAVGRLGAVLLLSVQIDADGNVTSATVQQSAHPVYDRLVVQAARGWRYAPATLNGRPIPSEKTVSIQTAR
jgi:TonB family protein